MPATIGTSRERDNTPLSVPAPALPSVVAIPLWSTFSLPQAASSRIPNWTSAVALLSLMTCPARLTKQTPLRDAVNVNAVEGPSLLNVADVVGLQYVVPTP